MDVTPDLISRYADGCATAEETEAVEALVAKDPALAAELEDLRLISDLFGHIEPEKVSKGLEQRLYALDAAAPARGFRLLGGAPEPRRVSWQAKAAAIAALVLVAVGVVKLSNRPDVVLRDVARLKVGPHGQLTDVERLDEVTVKAGETLRVGEDERLSFRTADGDRVTLLPGGALAIGDPVDGELFELERGTTLCSVLRHDSARTVQAGPYRIRVAGEAHFGVAVARAHVRPAGAARGDVEVTVTVSRGAVEILSNGDRETLSAAERAVFTEKGEKKTHAAEDPVYFELLKVYLEQSYEVIRGYSTGEPGVVPIRQRWVGQPDGGAVLALSDGGEGALGATHLVLSVAASRPGPLRLTRLRPLRDRPGEAEALTVTTPPVGTDWTVVAVPRADFDGPTAERSVRRVGEEMSRLVRLELTSSQQGTRVVVQKSLWASRAPVEVSK